MTDGWEQRMAERAQGRSVVREAEAITANPDVEEQPIEDGLCISAPFGFTVGDLHHRPL